MQVHPKNKVNLILASSSTKISLWNMQDEDYIVSIFDFADKFLTLDGDVLLFHLDDPLIFKEIRLYLDSYNF